MIDLPQTLRYGVVSGICLTVGTVSIPLLSWWGLHYAVATALAFCVVAVLGFSLHNLWTFRVDFRLSSFVRYVSSIALNLPLAVVLVGIAHDLAGLSVAASSALANAALVVWNFAAARWAMLRPAAGARP
ncbi:MAG TPA: GtrA family protein [Croceibacterium sp.]